MGDRVLVIGFCLGITGILLTVILIPLSFSYIDYYDYGLVQRKSTGSVDTSKVYDGGRYFIGPDYTFIKYQASAHLESFEALGVFSAPEASKNSSVGLEFKIDLDFSYFLIKDEIGEVHQESAGNYRPIIRSRAQEAIKNVAADKVSFTEFFEDRKRVEALFREAVEDRWNSPPKLHCTMDQFHLGRVRIPEAVGAKQLDAQVSPSLAPAP